MLYLWISRCWAKEEKARKARATRRVKARAKSKKIENNKDEKDKDKGRKGKGKNNAKATEYFAEYCLHCTGWRHMKKDCWWNEKAKGGKNTASLDNPDTPAADATTEPSITGDADTV